MVARKDGLPPQRHPPEVWASIRTAYTTTSATAAILEKRFGVKEATIRARASREGWTKQAAWDEAERALNAPEPAAPPSPALEAAASGDPVEIIHLTVVQAANALAAGRSAEAIATIKAGTAVAELVEVLRGLRSARAAPRPAEGH